MKREKMRFTLILILLLLLTYASGRAYALSCAPPSLDKSIVTNSVAVFEGVEGVCRQTNQDQGGKIVRDTFGL